MSLKAAKKALSDYFGYSSFRPMQEDVIKAILEGKDCLVLMPTGGGKSICYQIPAMVLKGMCVVVSPLIALMRDQVEALRENGIPAAYLNSSMDFKDYMHVIEEVKLAEIKLLYISPEKLLTSEIKDLLNSVKLSLFAIDEAHCISAWGHDFRPEYTQLELLKTRFKGVPIVALTATADKNTRKDILNQLGLRQPEIFISSFDRPNLSLTVLPGQNKIQKILDFLAVRPNQSGIIYCLSRKGTETLADKLKAKGYSASFYHAGLGPKIREKVQDQFLN
ncbi:MAG: RecQ family ATP-dependent DNA helicase, partial [Bacteroidota bacterium]